MDENALHFLEAADIELCGNGFSPAEIG
jgi:hypothetical protein